MSQTWDVVVLGGTPFGTGAPLGDYQIARALSAHRGVLYVDPPRFLHTRGGGGRQLRPSLRSESERLHVLTPVAPPFADRRRGRWVGDAAIGAQVRRAVSSALSGRQVIVSFTPRRGFMPTVPRAAFVYWVRDRLDSSPSLRHRAGFVDRHRAMIEGSDLVTAVSPVLVDHVAEEFGRRPALVRNGCDVEHFARAPDSPRVVGRPDGVVVGYAGGISWRVDLDLVATMARSRPEWTFVLVGEATVELPVLPNLVAVGRRPFAELPSWFRAFDVAVVPYVLDQFNAASDPLKVLEYLAAGLPVVGTAVPALVELGSLVSVAVDANGMVDAIERVLHDHDPEPGRRYAATNSWAVRAETLVTLIEDQMW